MVSFPKPAVICRTNHVDTELDIYWITRGWYRKIQSLYTYFWLLILWPWYRTWPLSISRGFNRVFATDVACQKGTFTLRTSGSVPFWDALVLQLLRPVFLNLSCLFPTFHLEYPSVFSRFCSLVLSMICLWLSKQEALTPPGHVVSPLASRGPMNVLFCKCHIDGTSFLLYFTFRKLSLWTL